MRAWFRFAKTSRDARGKFFCASSLRQKKIGPCLRLWARGSPSFSSSVSLATEGVGAPQGAWPRLRQTGPGVRCSRASPDRRALGVKRHAPRLAARQRGILAFMPLTVVGPGRVVVPDEAARVRPGDEVASSIARRCRSRSPLARRLMRTPPGGMDRDGGNITTLKVKSSIIFTIGILLYGE